MTGRASSRVGICMAFVFRRELPNDHVRASIHERAPGTGSQPSPTRSLGDMYLLYGTASAARGIDSGLNSGIAILQARSWERIADPLGPVRKVRDRVWLRCRRAGSSRHAPAMAMSSKQYGSPVIAWLRPPATRVYADLAAAHAGIRGAERVAGRWTGSIGPGGSAASRSAASSIRSGVESSQSGAG